MRRMTKNITNAWTVSGIMLSDSALRKHYFKMFSFDIVFFLFVISLTALIIDILFF